MIWPLNFDLIKHTLLTSYLWLTSTTCNKTKFNKYFQSMNFDLNINSLIPHLWVHRDTQTTWNKNLSLLNETCMQRTSYRGSRTEASQSILSHPPRGRLLAVHACVLLVADIFIRLFLQERRRPLILIQHCRWHEWPVAGRRSDWIRALGMGGTLSSVKPNDPI